MRLDKRWKDVGVSHGTMREEDLIPSFLSVLEAEAGNMDPSMRQRVADIRKAADWLLDEQEWDEEDQETATDLTHELFDFLDEIAPEGCCFGSHEGDGSDYGFWSIPEEEEDEIEVIGNGHWRYLDPDGFFTYRGSQYRLDDFMAPASAAPTVIQEHDGYQPDSFFSGILIDLHPEGDAVRVWTYIS